MRFGFVLIWKLLMFVDDRGIPNRTQSLGKYNDELWSFLKIRTLRFRNQASHCYSNTLRWESRANSLTTNQSARCFCIRARQVFCLPAPCFLHWRKRCFLTWERMKCPKRPYPCANFSPFLKEWSLHKHEVCYHEPLSRFEDALNYWLAHYNWSLVLSVYYIH